MSTTVKFVISAAFLSAIAVGVGFLLSGDEEFDWGLTLALVGLAICGEGLRVWIRRGLAKRRQSSKT